MGHIQNRLTTTTTRPTTTTTILLLLLLLLLLLECSRQVQHCPGLFSSYVPFIFHVVALHPVQHRSSLSSTASPPLLHSTTTTTTSIFVYRLVFWKLLDRVPKVEHFEIVYRNKKRFLQGGVTKFGMQSHEGDILEGHPPPPTAAEPQQNHRSRSVRGLIVSKQ